MLQFLCRITIEFMCSYLPHKISPFSLIKKRTKKKFINMSFVRSLSNEEKAAIVLNFVFPCNTPTLLICIFVSPWYPKWEHVLWAQETFLGILGVSFSSFFSQNLSKPLVFGVLPEYNKGANWIYFFSQFSGEDTTLQVSSVCSKNGEQAFVQFSVSFLPCSASIWQGYQVFRVLCVICRYEELNSFFIVVIFSWKRPRIQGTRRIPMEHLDLWMALGSCKNVQQASRSPWLVPGWTLHLTLM